MLFLEKSETTKTWHLPQLFLFDLIKKKFLIFLIFNKN